MLTLNIPQLGWARVCKQNFDVNGHNFKGKGQKVKMTQQYIAGFPKLISPMTKAGKTLFAPIKPTNPSV